MAFLHSLLLVAVILSSCNGLESRSFRPSEEASLAVNNVFHSILDSRGTSLRQIHDRIAAADTDLDLIVSGINSELKSKILEIDGDLLKIDSENLRALISDGLRLKIRKSFAQNPALADVLEKSVHEQLEARSQRLKEVALSNPIEVNAVRALLESHKQERQKRGVRAAGEFDLSQIITDLVFQILQEQFSSIIYEVLNSAKSLLLQFYSAEAPTNEIEKIIAFAKNTLLQRAVELITVIQQNIKTIVPTNNTESLQARRKRAAEDGTGAGTDGEAGSGDGAGDDSGAVSFGALDLLFQGLFSFLSILTTPLNLILKVLLNGLLGILSPLLGTTVVNVALNAVNPLLDLLLPTVLPF